MCFVDKEVVEFIVRKSKCTAVEPDEEGGFGTWSDNTRDVFAAIVHSKVDISFDVAQHLLAPCTTLSIGSYRHGGREHGRAVNFVGKEPLCEGFAQLIIGHDSPTAHYTSAIKGLGGGTKGDAIVTRSLRHRSKGHVLGRIEGNVGMNFIAHHQDIVL